MNFSDKKFQLFGAGQMGRAAMERLSLNLEKCCPRALLVQLPPPI
jgi:hypothetical protein